MRAMTRAVEEPHPRSLTPPMHRDHQAWAAGDQRYDGIGARLRANPLGVAYVFPGSPAEQSGLKFGDDILSIDGQPAEGLSAAEAVAMVRGEIGTFVHLTLRRQDVPAVWEVDVARADVVLPMIE